MAMRQSVYEITSAKHSEMDAHLRFYRNVTGLGIYAMPLLGSNPPMATIVAAGNVAGPATDHHPARAECGMTALDA